MYVLAAQLCSHLALVGKRSPQSLVGVLSNQPHPADITFFFLYQTSLGLTLHAHGTCTGMSHKFLAIASLWDPSKTFNYPHLGPLGHVIPSCKQSAFLWCWRLADIGSSGRCTLESRCQPVLGHCNRKGRAICSGNNHL